MVADVGARQDAVAVASALSADNPDLRRAFAGFSNRPRPASRTQISQLSKDRRGFLFALAINANHSH
jgi:hypothetical protein